MPGPARRGRSHRAVRTASVLAAFGVVVTLVAAGTPGGASDDPASVPEAAAAAEPSPTASASPTPSPTAPPAADPLAAPASSARPRPAPPAAKAVDTLTTAGARARRVTDTTKDWASFTLVDRKTGKVVGDRRSTQVTFTESTVKAWLAADLLATRARQGTSLTAYETARMTSMIRESDDNAAEVIWRWLGADVSIDNMITTCKLQDTRIYHDWWSKTQISSRDLARLGDCIVPGKGKFLSPQVGAPLLQLMRSVDESNAFGIQQASPAGQGVRIAVKNGWTEHGSTGQWNVNCLGIWGPGGRWVLAVTTRYPIGDGLGYGAAVCRRVTTALFPLVKTG
jgi:beta-lactamase family protein